MGGAESMTSSCEAMKEVTTYIDAPPERCDALAEDGILIYGNDLSVLENLESFRRHGGKLKTVSR